ncbi:MAG: hypothetical protein D6797_08870 [Bdellovibrio sp.]|nr:MAG: hypothetical protein D6797_08870 [Bdellovibrio sp.]
MRSPVYRNLDQPLQILGFSIPELIFLVVVFVLGEEVLNLFDASRAWAFLVTIIFAIGFYWMRRSLGDYFGKRLLRFFQLPSHLYSKLLVLETEKKETQK